MKTKNIHNMKKIIFAVLVILTACGGKANNNPDANAALADTIPPAPAPLVFAEMQNRDQCFIVISKPELYLSVYEDQQGDTVLLARYPVCVGKNLGQKEKTGDMKTPECDYENPFSISQIQPASTWVHDFADGRGPILAYGNWFLRLSTPGFKGIGIHGSTNNEESVPGRGSEGCVRLLNDDLDELKEQYAFVGMKVVIEADR